MGEGVEMKSSQPTSQVVTQSIDPAMQPYISYGLSEAQKLYQSDRKSVV